MAGVTAIPPRAALARVWVSAASSPPETQSVAASGSPLSKTDDPGPDAWEITNGAHCRPAAAGSLRKVTGRRASRSPIRVPPPGLLNTVRPSSASLAPADQYR